MQRRVIKKIPQEFEGETETYFFRALVVVIERPRWYYGWFSFGIVFLKEFEKQILKERESSYKRVTTFGFTDLSPFARNAVECLVSDSFTQCFEVCSDCIWNRIRVYSCRSEQAIDTLDQQVLSRAVVSHWHPRPISVCCNHDVADILVRWV